MSAELINLLSDERTSNNDSIDFLNERKPEVQKNIDLFTPVCRAVDNQVVSIASSINAIQADIVTTAATAYAVGCGTTAGQTVIYPDIVRNYRYNVSTSGYDGDEPYAVTVSTLSASNVGVGTLIVHTASDTSQASLGVLYGNLGNCFRSLGVCQTGTCLQYAGIVTAKQSEIAAYRSQLVGILTTSNVLRDQRLNYEVQRYAQNNSIRVMNETNARIGIAITAIRTYTAV